MTLLPGRKCSSVWPQGADHAWRHPCADDAGYQAFRAKAHQPATEVVFSPRPCLFASALPQNARQQ